MSLLTGDPTRGQRGSEPVVACDDAGTGAGAVGTFGLDLVEGCETFLVVGGAQLLSEVIVADATNVRHGVRGRAILSDIEIMSKFNRFCICCGQT